MEDFKKRKFSFGYEDTDKKIEIDLYGLEFEIRNLANIKELEKVDRNSISIVEAQIEKILGEGAINKINRKRKEDGYQKLDLDIELNILGCILETYAKTITDNIIEKSENIKDDISKRVNGINRMNREQRRNYNRNNRRNYRGY